MTATLEKIYRYPVKGLSAQELVSTMLTAGEGLPDDRRFALLHGASAFDFDAPTWKPKTNFLMLARYERLAALKTDYDAETVTLTIRRGGRVVARGRIDTPIGCRLIEQFLAAYMAGDSPGQPRLIEAPGHMFTDASEKLVSIINAASVHDLERVVKHPVDPLRFRANLIISGIPAWNEQSWPGCTLAIGEARLLVLSPIDRCAATNVDPNSAARDLNIPLALTRGYGHCHCGVYAKVMESGEIHQGDLVDGSVN